MGCTKNFTIIMCAFLDICTRIDFFRYIKILFHKILNTPKHAFFVLAFFCNIDIDNDRIGYVLLGSIYVTISHT